MKKLLLLVMFFPLFFACKHNTSSGRHEEEPINGCGGEGFMCEPGFICVNGECVAEYPVGTKMCSSDGLKSMVMTETGWSTVDCQYGCSRGECREPLPECTRDDDCSSGFHCADNGRCVSD